MRTLVTLLTLGLYLSLAANAIAGSAAAGLTVIQIWAGPGNFVRVYVKGGNINANLPTSCSRSNAFALLIDDPNFKEMYVLVTTALVAGKSISIWIPDTDDCIGVFT